MTTNTTYELSRRNGAGVVLTDGKARYKVSDWSPGTGDVYGRAEAGDDWSDYRKLPRDLRLAEKTVADIYAASEHKAPPGSPAEESILAEMARDPKRRYGESADPVLRARRRLTGIDGLTQDIHDMLDPIRQRAWNLAQNTRRIAADMARIRLKDLEAAFPRHRFTAVSWHLDAYSLEVNPPLRGFGPHPRKNVGDLVCKTGWLHHPQAPFQDIARFIDAKSEEIAKIMTTLGDEFHADVGYVTTDAAHDRATDNGLSKPDTAQVEEAKP